MTTENTKKSWWKKIREGKDAKTLIRAFTFIWGIILIVVMTLANIGFKTFDPLSWLSNALILVGIIIFGLFMGESMGKDRQSTRKDGLFQTSLNEYNAIKKIIEDIEVFFGQFYMWYLNKEMEKKKIKYLINNNMDTLKAKWIVRYCDLDDFKELQEHAISKTNHSGEIVCIRKLANAEIEPVKYVLEGNIKLDASNQNYFLSAFAKSNDLSIVEIGKQLDKDIKYNRRANRITKIVITIFTSLLLGVLTIGDMMKAGDVQAWFNLVSRITVLFTSLCSGMIGGAIEVKLRAEKILNKIDVLKQFKSAYDKRLFIAKSEEELADEEYKAYVDGLKKENADNLIKEEESEVKENVGEVQKVV